MSSALGPEGQMSVKTGNIPDYVADKMGIPADLRTTPQERQQMMEQAAAMMQAQAQAEAQQGPAEAPPEGM
jgi:hypothetical protein